MISRESASLGNIRKLIREIIQEEIHALVEGLKKLDCAWVSPSGRQYKCVRGSKNDRANELTNFKFGSPQKAAKALEDRGWTWKQNIKI